MRVLDVVVVVAVCVCVNGKCARCIYRCVCFSLIIVWINFSIYKVVLVLFAYN